MEKLNVALIGSGSHAQKHLKMIANEPRLHLAAIAEIDPQRLEQANTEHNPERVFSNYLEMLEHCDLDMIYIVTMPGHLLSIVLECLKKDLHVSVEKSPGMNSAATKKMAEAARNSKGKAMVSFDRRYIPEILAVRRMLQERGGAIHAGVTYNKPLPTDFGILAPDPLIWDAIHSVDLLRWLAGPTEREAALPVEVYSDFQSGGRPNAHRHNALIRFDSGTMGTLTSHFGVGFRIQQAEAHAEDFSVYMDMTNKLRSWGKKQYTLYEAFPAEGWSRAGSTEGTSMDKPLDLEAVGGAEFNETQHFVDCILTDSTPWSNLDDAVQTMQLCEAIRSGHKGKISIN